jgi:PAS domain S-box-containing protein
MSLQSRDNLTESALIVAARLTIIYLAISVIWIAVSDRAVEALFGGSVMLLMAVQTMKGLAFVAASGLMIYILVYRAVQSRQASQEDRGRMEAMLAATFEQAAVGMAHVALDGRFIRFNRRLCEIVGYDASVLSRLTSQDITHPEDLPPDVAEADRMLRGEIDDYRIEKRYIRQNGSSVWIHLTGALVRTDGRPDYFVTVVEDIEDRKKAEQKTRELAAIVEYSDDAIVSLDLDGNVRTWNRGAEAVLGYTAEEIAGKSFLSFVPPDLAGEGVHLRERVLRGEAVLRFETERLRKGGERFPVALTFSPIRDNDGGVTGLAVIIRDMTERARYERELVEAKDRAEEMNRLKSAFLSNMSHEIRTPLTAIIGFSEVLAEEIEGRQQEFASMIGRSGERLMETLGSVLDLAELEAGAVRLTKGPIDLAYYVTQTVEMFRARSDAAGLRLHVIEPHEPIAVTADAAALNRVVMNLVANAIKFTPQGGITVQFDTAGDTARLSVEDTGIGISEPFLPRIFDEFKQESQGVCRDFEGSGLGLSISKRLVDLMEGSIEVRSELGRGTTFTVSLPRAPVTQFASTSRISA